MLTGHDGAAQVYGGDAVECGLGDQKRLENQPNGSHFDRGCSSVGCNRHVVVNNTIIGP
jgi:hypothetical protein